MNEHSVYYFGSLSSLIQEKKKLDDKSEHSRSSRRSRSSRKGTPDDTVKADSLLKGEGRNEDDDEDSVDMTPTNLQSAPSQSERFDPTSVKVTEDLADFSIVSETKRHEQESHSPGGVEEANTDGERKRREDEDESTASGGRAKRERKRRERKKGDGDASVGARSRRSDHSRSRSLSQSDEPKRTRKGDGDASVSSRVRSSDRSSTGHRNKSEDAKRRDRKRREEQRAEMDDSDYSITSHATNTTDRNPRGRSRGTTSGGRTVRHDRKNLDKTGSFDDDVSVSSYATTRSRDVSLSGRTGRRDRQRRYPNMGDDDSSVASQLSRVSQLSTANQISRSAQRTRSQSRSSSRSRSARHHVTSRSRVTTRPQYSERRVVDIEQTGETPTGDGETSPDAEETENVGAEAIIINNASNIIDPLEGDDKIEVKMCEEKQDPDDWKNDLDETEVGMGEPCSLEEQAKERHENWKDPEQPKTQSVRKKMSKKNKRRLAKCILLLLLLVGVALGVFFMLPKPSKTESPPEGQNATAIVTQPTVAPSSLRGSSTFVPSQGGSNTTSVSNTSAASSLAPMQATIAPTLRPSTFAPTIRLTIAPTPQPMMPSTPKPTQTAFGFGISETATPVAIAPDSLAAPFTVIAPSVNLALPTVSPTVEQGTDEPTIGSISLPTVKIDPAPTPVSSSAGDVPSLFATSSSSAPVL